MNSLKILNKKENEKMKVNEKGMYNYFMETIKNPIGVCALMGNIQCESAFRSDNLQDTFNKKLNMNDAEYTSMVDTGHYTKDRFVHDGAGFGLVQWTYHTRKENLYNFANERNVSIAEPVMQMDFCLFELKYYRCNGTDFLTYLKNVKSLNEATINIMKIYECPYDTSEPAQKARTNASNKLYEKLVLGTDDELRQPGTHIIQFGAFRSRESAENYRNKLANMYGNDVIMFFSNSWYRVAITGFYSYSEARRVIENRKLTDCFIKEL